MQHRNASTKHDLASHLDRLFSILHATDAKRLAFFDRQRWVQGETLPWQLQARPLSRRPLLKLLVRHHRPLGRLGF